jgi:hypothetical protein
MSPACLSPEYWLEDTILNCPTKQSLMIGATLVD